MDATPGDPDPADVLGNFLVNGASHRFPALQSERARYALSVIIKRWPISSLVEHANIIGMDRSHENFVDWLANKFTGCVPANYVSVLEMLVVRQLVENLENHVKEVETAILNNAVDADQVSKATRTLVDIARQTRAMIEGSTGFSLLKEHRAQLQEEINRIFRTYVMVFGLETLGF